MKTSANLVLLGIALLVSLCTSSVSARVITCDLYLAPMVPAKFSVVLDNGVAVDSAPVPATGGGLTMGFNIDGVSNGPHTVKAAACDAGGCTAFSSIFSFSGPALSVPTHIVCDPACAVVP